MSTAGVEALERAPKAKSHLLKHTLPEINVEEHFGTTDGKEIAKEIARMGQKELQVRRWPEIVTDALSEKQLADLFLCCVTGQVPECVRCSDFL